MIAGRFPAVGGVFYLERTKQNADVRKDIKTEKQTETSISAGGNVKSISVKLKDTLNMTPEDKLAAIEALELPEPDLSGYVKKDVADKYASEAANNGKELTAKMSEEEAAKVKAAEEYAAMQAELEELKTARSIDQQHSKIPVAWVRPENGG